MAYIQMDISSSALLRPVHVNVLLPGDQAMPGMEPPKGPFKTLYLLHGMFGNNHDWLHYTNIRRYAEEHNLCVIMPDGDNTYYVDKKEAHQEYGRFVGQELVEMTRRMFHLSDKKEDTWIAGLSMGGYGAILNGLKYGDNFGRICGLSVANISDDLEQLVAGHPYPPFDSTYIEAVLGDLKDLPETEESLEYLIRRRAEKGGELPEIFLACGQSDPFLNRNHKLRNWFTNAGYRVTYHETPGGHEWDFWDPQIRSFIEE